MSRHYTDHKDVKVLAKCPNNGTAASVEEWGYDAWDEPRDGPMPDRLTLQPDPPMRVLEFDAGTEHLTLELEANNVSREAMLSVDGAIALIEAYECSLCGAPLDVLGLDEPSEVLQ